MSPPQLLQSGTLLLHPAAGSVPCVVDGPLGEGGRSGGEVYMAHLLDQGGSPGTAGVLKHPATRDEYEALEALNAALPLCVGVPRLLASGSHGGKPYVMMELLGPPISKIVERLQDHPFEARWHATRVIGRMLLRRLEDIHSRGFVHCDVSPKNILFGRAVDSAAEEPRLPLFFVDYGCARRFPGGTPMKSFWGTIEFNSIRSAEGDEQERGPFDDLESLGWVLCHCLFGRLPWYKWLQDRQWDGNTRVYACRRVMEDKAMALRMGWSVFGMDWVHLGEMPPALVKYLHFCYRGGCLSGEEGLPNYHALAVLLGADALDDIYTGQAEREDARLLWTVWERVNRADQ